MSNGLWATSYRYEYPRPRINYLFGPQFEEIRNSIERNIQNLEKHVQETKLICWKSEWDECERRPSEYVYADYGQQLWKEKLRARDASCMARKLELIKLFHAEMLEYKKELQNKGKAVYRERL